MVRDDLGIKSKSMSVFRRLAGSIQANHIQVPLGPPLRADQTIQDAWDLLTETSMALGYDPMSRISLVLNENRFLAWIGLDMLDSTKRAVSDAAETISADVLVSADTPALEIAKLFASNAHHFYFVLEESSVTGTIHYEDLLEPPFKLCLFALTLELEAAALDLALQDAVASWSVLSEGRQQKALQTFQYKYSQPPGADQPPFDRFLRCTMFVDKGTILRKRKLIAEESEKIDAVFQRAERVRNSCAHTSSEHDFGLTLLDGASLRSFIVGTEEMIIAIRRQLQVSTPAIP